MQATQGSVQNLNLLQAGRGLRSRFALADSVGFVWNGEADVGFPSQLDKLRNIAAIYPNYIQIIGIKDYGIKALLDLKQARLCWRAYTFHMIYYLSAFIYDALHGYAHTNISSNNSFANSLSAAVMQVPKQIITKFNDPSRQLEIDGQRYERTLRSITIRGDVKLCAFF